MPTVALYLRSLPLTVTPATGKKVIAYGVELTQERYYLAAQADEIYLDPMGFVLVQGYDRYRIYLKDAGQWEAASRVHGRYFGEVRPANTLIEVSNLVGDYEVEIEAEAELAP
jgi:enamine deaminase RidA (YjgF/YER057c/UK114 family)